MQYINAWYAILMYCHIFVRIHLARMSANPHLNEATTLKLMAALTS